VWWWREVGGCRGEWSRRDLDGKEESKESMFVCAILGWRCLDWMGFEVDATAVTSVQCQIAEPKSRTCAFDKDLALRFPSHQTPDS
jgi:hypothetical protein